VITPADRSTSPPIINRPTGTATIPKNAACCVHAATPVCLSHRWFELASVIANITNTNTAASSEPSSGRRSVRVIRLIGTSRSSCDGGAATGGEVALIVVRVTRVSPPGERSTPARWPSSSVLARGDRRRDLSDVRLGHDQRPAGHGRAAAHGLAVLALVQVEEHERQVAL